MEPRLEHGAGLRRLGGLALQPSEGSTTKEIYRAFGVWSSTQGRGDRVQTETQLALKLRALGIKKTRVQEHGRREVRWGLQVRATAEQAL